MLHEPQGGSSPVRRAVLLVAVMAVALGVRLYSASYAQNIASDGTVYLVMARQLAQDSTRAVAQGYRYHPAYAAAVAAVAGPLRLDWPDGWIAAARGISIASSLLTLAMVYFFAARMFNRPIAIVTALFLSLAMGNIEVGGDVLSDPFAMAMAMSAIVAGLRCEQAVRDKSWTAVALAASVGLLAGLGYLTRPEELIAAGVAVLLLLRVRPADGRQRAIQWTAIAAIVAATLICVLPYATAIGGLTHKKSFSDFVLAGGDRTMLAHASATPQLLEAVRRVIDRYRASVGTPISVLGLVCLLTWFGRYALRLRLGDKAVIRPAGSPMIAMVTVAVVLGIVLTMLEYNHLHLQPDGRWSERYISDRHGMLPGLVLAPCAGAGLVILIQLTLWLAGIVGRRLARIAITGPKALQALAAAPIKLLAGRPQVAAYLWLAGIVVALSFNAFRIPHEGKACYRRAGEEIRQRFGAGHAVLADNCWVPFFAGAPAGQFQTGSFEPCMFEPRDFVPDKLVELATSRGYEFLELSMSKSEPADKADLMAAVRADGRFEPLLVLQSARTRQRPPRTQEAWVFRIVRQPATTLSQAR